MANISIKELSQTISKLVNLDTEQQNLVELAVNRAVSTKEIFGGQAPLIPNDSIVKDPIIAGRIFPITTGRIKPKGC